MYVIEVSPAADRDLTKLSKRIAQEDFTRLSTAIGMFEEEPRPVGARKIVGAVGVFRVRVGDYRIVYEIDDKKKLVILLHISRRSETTYS